MLRHRLILAFFLGIVPLIYFQAEELLLAFYVLFPFVIFPIFYFLSQGTVWYAWASLALTLAVYGNYLYRFPTFEMFLFGLESSLVVAGLIFYRTQWERAVRGAEAAATKSKQELEALKQKYESRLESFRYLEKQVSSLLELFEITRDFSDCLRHEAMAELLFKRLLPELPFRKMRLALVDRSSSEGDTHRVFIITKEGVKLDVQGEWLPEEQKILQGVPRTTSVIKKEDDVWLFPLVADQKLHAILRIEGAKATDLAKFEVLVAHLILQVKKTDLYETVRELSIRDGLTGVFVRRHFLERFQDELVRSRKYCLPLALLMLDIDHFKRYNDDFGHLVGDATLKEVARLLKANLRDVDIVARYGGEEFVIVIPESRRQQALEVAERIRSNIARHRFRVYDYETRVTVSIGIALYTAKGSAGDVEKENNTVLELIQQADKALYRAKEEGRNRIVLYEDL